MNMSRPTRTLSQLPTEILALILQNVQRPRDLRSCCLVSRRFNNVSERELYKVVKIDRLPRARRFALALRRRPERRALLRKVIMISSIVPSESGLDSYWTSMMICPPLVTCPNLEELNLGSHYYHEESLPAIDASISDEVQYHMYDLFDMLRQASLHTPPPERVLTKLTTLRLHFKPIGILKHRWEPGPELLHVFLSPTLRDISLHRCSLENVSTSLDDIQCAAFNKSTPLESLRLQDSWISVHVLRRILALPCRLKTFFLNDECRMGPTIFSSVDDWTEMLSQQKDSLEEIVILGTAKWNHFNGPLDLRGMARLRLLAGWIFNADEDKIKRLPHVKTMRPSQYEGMLERTRPEWAFWISDDEVVAAEQGHSEWFHHDDIYSDVDDMDMDDYDENGAWIFEI